MSRTFNNQHCKVINFESPELKANPRCESVSFVYSFTAITSWSKTCWSSSLCCSSWRFEALFMSAFSYLIAWTFNVVTQTISPGFSNRPLSQDCGEVKEQRKVNQVCESFRFHYQALWTKRGYLQLQSHIKINSGYNQQKFYVDEQAGRTLWVSICWQNQVVNCIKNCMAFLVSSSVRLYFNRQYCVKKMVETSQMRSAVELMLERCCEEDPGSWNWNHIINPWKQSCRKQWKEF